jgi:hypothetical protein
MNASSKTGDTLFHQLIDQLPSDVTSSFTETQMQTLQRACMGLRWKRHAVDVRFTVPFPGKGFYVVLLAGAEQRSRTSLKQRRLERKGYPIQKATGLILTTTFFSLLATLGITQLNRLNHPPESVFPTVVPWYKTQATCENTGRTWQAGSCWEKQWSHMF